MGKLLKLYCASIVLMGTVFLMPHTLDSNDFDPLTLLKQARNEFEKINDYTALFIKQQRSAEMIGVLGAYADKREEIMMKFKKPFCIYYKWMTPDKGKEVIYVHGKNKNNLIAHLGGAISLFPISKWLSPTDPLAMKGNKYPITRSGIGNMLESLLDVYEKAKSNNELASFYMGPENVDGRDTYVIGRRLPKKENYPCYLSITNIDVLTKLPIRVASFDWSYGLLEMYYYKDLKVNQGLTDKDFDPNNNKYRFGFFKL